MTIHRIPRPEPQLTALRGFVDSLSPDVATEKTLRDLRIRTYCRLLTWPEFQVLCEELSVDPGKRSQRTVVVLEVIEALETQ